MAKIRKDTGGRKTLQNTIQKRFKTLFSGQEEPPSYMSIRQVEALQARLVELEANQAGRPHRVQQAAPNAVEMKISSVASNPESQLLSALPETPMGRESSKRSNGMFRTLNNFLDVMFSRQNHLSEHREKAQAPGSLSLSGRFASLSMAIVLLFLASFSVGIVITSKLAAGKTEHATQLSTLYQEARYAVGAEESLERKYRLEPGPEVRTNYQNAAKTLVEKLTAIKNFDASEAPLVNKVIGLHDSYLKSISKMFTAVDSGDTKLVLAIDSGEVDPSFSEIDQLVNTAADQRQQVAQQSMAENAHIQNLVLGATPIVFVIGLTLIYIFWSVLRTYQNRVEQANQLASQSEHESQLQTASILKQHMTASEVGRIISERTEDPTSMLGKAVEVIREQFKLYYAQIYLTDPSGQTLTLRAGTGEAGVELLQRRHHLMVGSGSLNSRAAVEKRALLVEDTSQSMDFLPNPLLPHTCSEMAIPLIADGQVLGVLDMQSDQPGLLNESNLSTFETLAGQLAIALQNAALFAEAQQARSEIEAQVHRLTEHGWQEFLDGIERGQKIGFAFDQTGILPLKEDALTLPIQQALNTPITVTGTKIGTIQLARETESPWTTAETELIQVTADQLGQHIENLRLLAQADQYRSEAENAVRRLTREGWDSYLQEHREEPVGFAYDLNEVSPLDESEKDNQAAITRPLAVQNEIVGELSINTGENHQAGANELLSAVASQLSAHIENLRLTQQTQIALNETETLYKASAELNTATTYDEILDVLRGFTLLGHETMNVSVNLFDRPWSSSEEPTWIKTLARWTAVSPRATSDQYRLSDFPLARQLLQPDAPTLIETVVGDPRMDDNARRLYAVQFGAQSTIFVPLVVGGQWLGYLNAMYEHPTSFPEAEVRELMALSAQAAVAINNMRLLLLTEERAQREQALRQITNALRSSTNPATIMRTAVRELGNLLGRKTAVQMLTPEQANQAEPAISDGNESASPANQS